MIKKWIINGDLHGEFERLEYLQNEIPNETAIICLGDFGGYYYLNNKCILCVVEIFVYLDNFF